MTVLRVNATTMIEEGRQRNSAIPQGVLLRRIRVENPGADAFGTIWRLPDFTIGAELNLAGIVHRI
jgi:hypothetical protein